MACSKSLSEDLEHRLLLLSLELILSAHRLLPLAASAVRELLDGEITSIFPNVF